MAIKFGSETGYQVRTDYRVNEGELDCGTTVHMFIRNIEKSYTFSDEFSLCSIGIIDGGGAEMCYENASLKIREEAMPKYKPIDSALGATAEALAIMGQAGEAVTELACVPLRIKTLTVELTCTFKDMDATPDPDDILAITTSDGLQILGAFFAVPTTGTYIITTKTTDQPADDFGSKTMTYTKKLPYPDNATRTLYLDGVDDYFASDPNITFDPNRSTVEREVQFRQGDVPIQSLTVTEYGIANVDS